MGLRGGLREEREEKENSTKKAEGGRKVKGVTFSRSARPRGLERN